MCSDSPTHIVMVGTSADVGMISRFSIGLGLGVWLGLVLGFRVRYEDSRWTCKTVSIGVGL